MLQLSIIVILMSLPAILYKVKLTKIEKAVIDISKAPFVALDKLDDSNHILSLFIRFILAFSLLSIMLSEGAYNFVRENTIITLTLMVPMILSASLIIRDYYTKHSPSIVDKFLAYIGLLGGIYMLVTEVII